MISFDAEMLTRAAGSAISRHLAGNEKAIKYLEANAVESAVWRVLGPVWEEEDSASTIWVYGDPPWREYRRLDVGLARIDYLLHRSPSKCLIS